MQPAQRPASRVYVHLSVTVTLLSMLTLPAGANPARPQDVQQRVQDWVSSASVYAQFQEFSMSLPQGAWLDRVLLQETAAIVYVTLPADFLDHLTDVACENIIREQVELLRDVDGVSTYMLMARPDDKPGAEHQPLPAFLPQPTGELNKLEPLFADPPDVRGGLPTYNPGRPNGALSGKTVFLSPGHGWRYSSTLGRWGTQRGNWGGLIEDMSNGEAVMQHLAQYLHNAGANVWTCRERDFNPEMVIVDNSAGEPSYTTTGAWTSSTAAGTWYGSDYQHSAVSTVETAVATYAPNIPATDYYAVYVWTPSSSNRATDATVRVNHTGGTTTHIINMQQDGNTWRFLGQYRFDAGRDAAKGSVEFSNIGSDPSKFVIADAVRFGGGMGDYVDGGSVSGYPRWEESGNYFPVFMGQSSAPNGTVSGMPLYAKWESESWEDSIYFSWHTNATSAHTGHGTQMYVYAPGQPPPGPFGDFGGVVGGDTLCDAHLR